MRLKTAILKAADFLDRHPRLFEFMSIEIPDSCKTPGCALGWIHFFSKVPGSVSSGGRIIEASHFPGLRNESDFYERMDKIYKSVKWRDNARRCATALRKYAAKYGSESKIEVKHD
jgi:hypothetical protein